MGKQTLKLSGHAIIINLVDDNFEDEAEAVMLDQWYDRHTRSWVIQLKDAEGNQIGEADYSGTKSSSDYAMSQMLKAAPHLKRRERK